LRFAVDGYFSISWTKRNRQTGPLSVLGAAEVGTLAVVIEDPPCM
jgi:acetamidase/formamidase